jgi:hypothetical protein
MVTNAPQGGSDTTVRPTVFVGLGGTGMEVLLRLRRRILQAEWNRNRLNSLAEFPVASFLYIDTDQNKGQESDRPAATDPMAEAVEFGEGDALQASVDIGYYQSNRKNYPLIDEWFPARDLSRIDASKGAGQIRAISRLLFFDQFAQLRSLIAAKGNAVMENINTAHALTHLGMATQRELRVVVVCSIAGGTGSGMFIDMGLAIRAMVAPKPKIVDLFMMLPSGYAANNQDRVFANGFAALSELEHSMRPHPNPPYATRWPGNYEPTATEGDAKPYSNVYMFDTKNLVKDSTEDVSNIYDMIADMLFEDFGSNEFARRKRAVDVNQEQHKMTLWYPSIEGEYFLSYSKGYTAAGQSTVSTTGSLEHEAVLSDASEMMLKSFFGVGEGPDRKPTVKYRDAFVRDRMALMPQMFDDFPEFLDPRPSAIPGFSIIEQLLVSDDQKSIHGRLIENLADEFRAIMEQASEPKDWAAQAARLRDRYEAEVLEKAGTTSIRRQEISDARRRLYRDFTAEEGERSLKQALFSYVDDRERGGLDFTIALIEQVREELTRDGTGAAARLQQAAADLSGVANGIIERHLGNSLKKLERAAKPNMLGRVDRIASEEYVRHFEQDLGEALKFWLRSIAALEARGLILDLAAYLGDSRLDETTGEPRWSGVAKELDEGRQAVHAAIELIAAEGRKVRDAVNRPDNGVYIVIDRGRSQAAATRAQKEVKLWADEVFTSYQGCKALLPTLQDPGGRLELINNLRNLAKRKLEAEEKQIPNASDALNDLPDGEKAKVIKRMLERAMPWIPASFTGFELEGKNFKMIIAAPDGATFDKRFRGLIEQQMPPGFGIARPTIESAGVAGRVICYCELSGIPLNVLTPLGADWRRAYEKERDKPDAIPLHNHEDELRFPNPVVPSNREVEQQRETLGLYLKGVIYGLLSRGGGSTGYKSRAREGRYYLDMSRHDLQSVGNERKIRAKGFDLNHLARLKALVDEFEGKMSHIQWVAAAALAEWTAKRAYAPPLIERSAGSEDRRAGMANRVARRLAEEFKVRARRRPPAAPLPGTPEELLNRLFDHIPEYTLVIDGSLSDVEGNEVSLDEDDLDQNRATDKRRIDPGKFTEAHLTSLVTEPEPAAAPAPPAPSAAASYFVGVDGETTGPYGLAELGQMSRDGTLTPASLVYNANGGGDWVAAKQEPALAVLFTAKPPPPPKTPPPPPPKAG